MLNIKLNYHVTFRSIVRLSRVSNTYLMSEISYFSMSKLSVAQQEKNSRTFKDFYCFYRTSIAFQGHSRLGILFFKFSQRLSRIFKDRAWNPVSCFIYPQFKENVF